VKRDWKAARAKVDRENACRVCGIGGRLESAHVVPRSLGGGQSEDSIVPLCPDHHRDYDGRRLDLLPHLTHDEQAEAVRVLGLERARRRLSPEAA
jgi:5-methylcytosine-specific restriction endonuclease McrA